MNPLCERILAEGKHLGNGILKVDSFMNHQIDPALMRFVGEEIDRRFRATNPTRILTAETSGIAPAVAAGMCLNVPVVFARKHQPITMAAEPYRESSVSPTHGKQVELIVSTEYMRPGDRVLIVDDFLSSGQTILALYHLIQQSKAELVGVATVIEKAFKQGREQLKELNVPIDSIAVIERFDGDQIIVSGVDTSKAISSL